jgi:hypothetical protein
MIEGTVDAAEMLRFITLLARYARSSQQQRSVTVDVRFAAIAGARDIRGKTTRGPGLLVAADSHVVEPGARPY